MPPTQITEANVTVLDLLVANWNAANTQSITPDITNAWWNRQGDTTQAKVTVTSGGEIEFLRGMTTNGIASFWDGTVDVNCWTTPKVFASGNQGALSRKLVYQMRQEVDRIIRINQNAVAGLLHLGVIARRPLHDDTEDPTVFRWLAEVGYSWIEQPA